MKYIIREMHVYEEDMHVFYISNDKNTPFMDEDDARSLRDALRDELVCKDVKNVFVDLLSADQYPGSRVVEYKLVQGRWTLSFGPGAEDQHLTPVLTKIPKEA